MGQLQLYRKEQGHTMRASLVYADINDTIKGFNAIIDGEYDHLPEAAFNLVGTIEDAVVKGEKLLADVAK